MALFNKNKNPMEEIKGFKAQGMSDNQIIEELHQKGYSLPQINNALSHSAMTPDNQDITIDHQGEMQEQKPFPQTNTESQEVGDREPVKEEFSENIQSRIEEIAETIIDEKWDLLVEEVKKVISWKEKVEGEVDSMKKDISNLKEDFKELHQGVLGKLGDYDDRMSEVGTELKAVGKVFKDVIPEFVENVKELKSITKKKKN